MGRAHKKSKMSGAMDRYRAKPGEAVDLSRWDPGRTELFQGDKREAESTLKDLNARMETLQELLYAEKKHKVLVVLQGMDTGGKDGTIRHVFEGVNPQGVKVASFKGPTSEELAHDYLWRVHCHTPGSGEIAIFNRSHYEDVLIVRVHNLVPHKVWRKRYDHINAFERMLVDEGTSIRKFFLHIDRSEQKKRLQERLEDPNKQWKFDPSDLKERRLWSQYQEAYEEMLGRTSTDWAPWYIVPANHKWYRNLVVATVLVEALESLKMNYPEPGGTLSEVVVK
jgi:PPK2 family polyphosphate:nucleotide phosphotransferase